MMNAACYLLGIDIGTSACKLALFRMDGSPVCAVSEEYTVNYPQPGWAEQDPTEWWRAVCAGIRRLFSANSIDAACVAGVGIDGQSWSAIALNGAGDVLTPTPIWMDTRSAAICEELNTQIGAERIFNLSGNPLKPQYSTAKILWYKRNLPQIYKQIDKIVQSNSYIAYRLTGVITQDLSQGYGLHCFDLRKGRWDESMCHEMGIERSFLPEIVACHQVVGTVTAEAAQQCGLLEGTPVVAGGLDAACGTLGVGVINAGQTQEQGGQAGGMSICIDNYCADPRLICGFHVVPDLWLLQGGTTGGGGTLNWFEKQFAYEERESAKRDGCSSFEKLSAEAGTVAAGSEGVVFLPYMAGERSPLWDEKAKGVFYGLDYSKTKSHLTRAIMEGVAYALRHNLEVAAEVGARADVLRAMGGSANSLVWTQLKADVTGCRIDVPSSDMATTLGAAILAGVGVGMYKDFADATAQTVRVQRSHEPDLNNKEVYDSGYRTYRALYPALKPVMDGSVE